MHIVLPIEGVSLELDFFRHEIKQHYASIHIVDSSYYGVDTITFCEVNNYVLITQQVYKEIHTNLLTIPLETKYTLPYGLMYVNETTPATKKLFRLLQKKREVLSQSHYVKALN